MRTPPITPLESPPGTEAMMLFVGGPMDGDRRMVALNHGNYMIMHAKNGPDGRVDITSLVGHNYKPVRLSVGGAVWQIFVHEDLTPDQMFQELLDCYGKDPEPDLTKIVSDSKLAQWDDRRVDRPAIIPDGSPYRLFLWNHTNNRDEMMLEAVDQDGLQQITRECERYIQGGRDSWIVDVRGNVITGAACSQCNSRSNLYAIRRDDRVAEFRCSQHIPLPGEFIGSCMRLRASIGMPPFANFETARPLVCTICGRARCAHLGTELPRFQTPTANCTMCDGTGGRNYFYSQDHAVAVDCPNCNGGDRQRWIDEEQRWRTR